MGLPQEGRPPTCRRDRALGCEHNPPLRRLEPKGPRTPTLKRSGAMPHESPCSASVLRQVLWALPRGGPQPRH